MRNGWFLTAPKTTDGNIASIAFADYSKKLNVNDSFRPVVYGYNGDGYLVNADIAGYRLVALPEMESRFPTIRFRSKPQATIVLKRLSALKRHQ